MSIAYETLIGYDFNSQGMYREKVYLYSETEMGDYLRSHAGAAFREGREFMLTDTGDNAVLHIKDGKVLFAGGYDVGMFEEHLRYGLGG